MIKIVDNFLDFPEEYYRLCKELKFYNQEDFSNKILNAGFANVEYRNLTNGIAAIHSGWKIE